MSRNTGTTCARPASPNRKPHLCLLINFGPSKVEIRHITPVLRVLIPPVACSLAQARSHAIPLIPAYPTSSALKNAWPWTRRAEFHSWPGSTPGPGSARATNRHADGGRHPRLFPRKTNTYTPIPHAHEDCTTVPMDHRHRRLLSKPFYSGTGTQMGLIGSPASTFRTNGTESFSDAFTVSP